MAVNQLKTLYQNESFSY